MVRRALFSMRDNYDSYASLISLVNEKRPIDLIMQQREPTPLNSRIAHEVNSWLKEKGYPLILTGCTADTVISNAELSSGSLFDTYPNHLHGKISTSDGLLIEYSDDGSNVYDLKKDWDWNLELLDEEVDDSGLPQVTINRLFQLKSNENHQKLFGF